MLPEYHDWEQVWHLGIHQVMNCPSAVLYHLGVSISFQMDLFEGEPNRKECDDQLSILGPSGPRLYRLWLCPLKKSGEEPCEVPILYINLSNWIN